MAFQTEIRHRPTSIGATNSSTSVGDESTEIVATYTGREYLSITNVSTEIVYISLGGAATTTSGHQINANGGSIILGPNSDIPWTGTVNGIVNSDTSRTVLTIEF